LWPFGNYSLAHPSKVNYQRSGRQNHNGLSAGTDWPPLLKTKIASPKPKVKQNANFFASQYHKNAINLFIYLIKYFAKTTKTAATY
jgi:hypothetical protein